MNSDPSGDKVKVMGAKVRVKIISMLVKVTWMRARSEMEREKEKNCSVLISSFVSFCDLYSNKQVPKGLHNSIFRSTS